MFNIGLDADTDLTLINKAISDKQKMDKKVQYEKHISMFLVTKSFIQRKNLILYGGLALNLALPRAKRFYDDYELPDYDFFSYSAKEHAIELADIYHKAGYNYVEVKPGIHHETYKVFVEFQPVADITDIPQKLFNSMLDLSLAERVQVVKNNPSLDINIAPLAFLRMAFHIELSRPNGHIERWPKVYSRMIIFYSIYPLMFAKCDEILVKDDNERVLALNTIIINYCKTHGLPVLGTTAVKVYMKEHKLRVKDKHIFDPKMPTVEIMSVTYEKTSEALRALLATMTEKGETIVLTAHSALNKSELFPKHVLLSLEMPDGKRRPLACIYNSQACYAYKEVDGLKVLTIDTLLSIMYATIFANRPYYSEEKIKCMINILLNIQSKHIKSTKAIWKRFELSCYGKQMTVEDIMRERWGEKHVFRIYRPGAVVNGTATKK